jgi:hypothetical protein
MIASGASMIKLLIKGTPSEARVAADLQCDCCAQYVARDQITRCWAYGIETYACDACRGVPPEDDENELDVDLEAHCRARSGLSVT